MCAQLARTAAPPGRIGARIYLTGQLELRDDAEPDPQVDKPDAHSAVSTGQLF